MSEDKSNWPQLETVDKPNNHTRKYSNIQLSPAATLVNVEISIEEPWRLNPTRFSSWRRLTRVLAWTLRFINNCKQHKKMRQVELSLEEVSDAENYIIKGMQKKECNEEYTALVKERITKTQ